MSPLPAAPPFIFGLPVSTTNLPGLDHLQYISHYSNITTNHNYKINKKIRKSTFDSYHSNTSFQLRIINGCTNY